MGKYELTKIKMSKLRETVDTDQLKKKCPTLSVCMSSCSPV